MVIEILPAAGFRRTRWANGGGVTSEIHVAPAEGDGFVWRVSLAEIAVDGPFSAFSGVERTILQISGPPLALAHAGPGAPTDEVALEPLVPHAFRGEWATTSRFLAPSGGAVARDLNLMVRRERATGRMAVVRAERQELAPPEGDGNAAALVYALGGAVTVSGRTLPAGDAALVTSVAAPVAIEASAADAVAVVSLVRIHA